MTVDRAYTITKNLGQVTLSRSPIASDAGRATLRATVYDSGDSSLISAASSRTLQVNASFSAAPSNIRLSDGGSINELAITNDVVGTVTANDNGAASELRYSIAQNSNFDINAITGKIFVKSGAKLNYETQSNYAVSVTVTDGEGLSSTQNIILNLNDVNEAPEAIGFTDARSLQVGVTGSNAQVVLATVADPDTQTAAYRNNDYRFSNGSTTFGAYTIDAQTGQITTNRALTAADAGQVSLIVVAYDATNNNLSVTRAFTVIVWAAGAPTNVRWANGGTINETAAAGDTVGTVTADDEGPSSQLRYSIVENDKFAIDATTGAITVKNTANLNYEAGSSYTLAVRVQNNNGSGKSTNYYITINLKDVNEAPTIIGFTNVQTLQAGVTGSNAQVVLATAIDPDTQNVAFCDNDYRFSNGSTTFGAYTIDAQTGQITTNRALTAADAGQVSLIVVAYDATSTKLSVAKTFTFNVAPTNVPTIAISAHGAVKVEGNSGTTEFVFIVARSSGVGSSSVNWTVSGMGPNPTSPGDFAGHSGTVAFAAGETSKEIRVQVIGDLEVEADETFEIALFSAVNGSITVGRANGVINNDDTPTGTSTVSIVAADANKEEGTGGASARTSYTFTVARTSDVGSSFVDWTIGGEGTHPAGADDFVTTSGTVRFDAGEVSKTVTVEVFADAFIESDEVFSVTLTNPVNTVISTTRGVAYGIILNDDSTPPPENQAPRDLSLSSYNVQELTANGTPIGIFAANDPDSISWTYALIGDGAGGRFKVDGLGRLLVNDGFKLDYEQATSYNITIRVTDSSGNIFDKTLTISVTDWGAEVTAGSIFDDIFKGGAGSDNLSGNAGNDRLYGSDGKDVLNGGVGIDTVSGGDGNDTLWGGAGKDVFVFDGKLGTSTTDRKVNFDTIKDYSVKDDLLWLENDLFKSNKALYKVIKKGAETKPLKLTSKFFTVGGTAKDKDDYFVYNAKKRVLSYDSDGSGLKDGIEIATFTNSKTLKNFKYTELFFI